MKKVFCLVFAMLFLLFSMVGCSDYSSNYRALGYVQSHSSDSDSMIFKEFEGTEVFTLKCKSKNQAAIDYSGELESGSLTVYYDCGGTKKELFSLNSKERIHSVSDLLPEDTITIIVKTSRKCRNGNLSLKIIDG